MNEGGELALLGRQMQLAAGVMLLIYVAAVPLVLPRELRFLRGAEPPFRARFVFLDILLQVCILLVLVPCVVTRQLNHVSMVIIMSGFAGLWIVVMAIAYLRYIYTYRILLTANIEQLKAAQEALAARARREHEQSDAHRGEDDV